MTPLCIFPVYACDKWLPIGNISRSTFEPALKSWKLILLILHQPTRMPNSSCSCCSVTKNLASHISGTKRATGDPRVPKQPEFWWLFRFPEKMIFEFQFFCNFGDFFPYLGNKKSYQRSAGVNGRTDGRTDGKRGPKLSRYDMTWVWLCTFVQEGSSMDGNLLHLTSPAATGQATRERARLTWIKRLGIGTSIEDKGGHNSWRFKDNTKVKTLPNKQCLECDAFHNCVVLQSINIMINNFKIVMIYTRHVAHPFTEVFVWIVAVRIVTAARRIFHIALWVTPSECTWRSCGRRPLTWLWPNFHIDLTGCGLFSANSRWTEWGSDGRALSSAAGS